MLSETGHSRGQHVIALLTLGSDCLGKNSYDESKCQKQIDALYECCSAFYDKFGEDAKTVCCPKVNLLRLKITQRAEAGSK